MAKSDTKAQLNTAAADAKAAASAVAAAAADAVDNAANAAVADVEQKAVAAAAPVVADVSADEAKAQSLVKTLEDSAVAFLKQGDAATHAALYRVVVALGGLHATINSALVSVEGDAKELLSKLKQSL